MSLQNNTLKCPFCGGEDTFLQDSTSSSTWVYYCEDCEESYRVIVPPGESVSHCNPGDLNLQYDWDPDDDMQGDWR